jgi:hypothetical protein
VVEAGGGDASAVGEERHAGHAGGVAGEDRRRAAGRRRRGTPGPTGGRFTATSSRSPDWVRVSGRTAGLFARER